MSIEVKVFPSGIRMDDQPLDKVSVDGFFYLLPPNWKLRRDGTIDKAADDIAVAVRNAVLNVLHKELRGKNET